MISNQATDAVWNIDLGPIKAKLMHMEAGEGWSRQRVDMVEVEYRRFLHLMKIYPNEQLAPSEDTDTFWHYHILDTMKYAVDCATVFGYFLHHFPYLGLRGEDDEQVLMQCGDRMRDLYESTFGVSYLSPVAMEATAPAYCSAPGKPSVSPAVNAAYCSAPGKQAAYCSAPGKQAAYCSAPGKQAAYCSAPGKQAAYCSAPGKQAAYCSAPGNRALGPATNTAYCSAPGQQTVERATDTALRLIQLKPSNSAYCSAPGVVATLPSRVGSAACGAPVLLAA
jgi:hypothetical protein